MSGSADGQFGQAPVGSSVQPCPLGQIHVDVLLEDGRPADAAVRVSLTGPDSANGSVAAGAGTWTSPKIRPGTYLVEATPTDVRGGYQPPDSANCELPESGVATATIQLEPYGSVAVTVTRRGSGESMSGVTVRLSGAGGTVEALTSSSGEVSFDRLVTRDPIRLEVDLGDRAVDFLAIEPRDVTVRPGTNDPLAVEAVPLAGLDVVAVADEGGTRRELPITVTLSPTGEGADRDAATDSASGTARFAGLAAGGYQVTATPARPADSYYTVQPVQVTLAEGEQRRLELTATRERSRIVVADRAGESGGLLRDLAVAPYGQSRDQVRSVPVGSATFTLPLPALDFDDVPFDAEAVYTDDALEAIAVTGFVEACGVRREMLFARTSRPVRTVLAVKFREWRFDREWGVFEWGPLAQHCVLSSGFLTLSASETTIKSAYLPAGAHDFFGDEELDLKQGINLYGKLDVGGFPALQTLLGWLGVSETYLKIQGYLAHDANLVFSKETREKQQPQEKVWDLALSASIPLPTGPWPSSMVKERELTLEVGAKREQKGRSPFVGRILDRSAGSTTPTATSPGSSASAGSSAPETGPATPQADLSDDVVNKPELAPPSDEELNAAPKEEAKPDWETEVKLRVKVEDAVKMPFFHFSRPWLASSLNQEDDEIEFSGAFQVEAGLEKVDQKSKLGESEVTLEYGTSFKLNLISDQVAAVHDLKVELNATKNTFKLAGALDLGRREKVAGVEIEHPLPGHGSKSEGPAGATPSSPASSTAPEAGKSGESASDGGSAKAAGKGKTKHWWDDCTVTVKVKPGVMLGVLDVIRDAADAIKAQRTGTP